MFSKSFDQVLCRFNAEPNIYNFYVLTYMPKTNYFKNFGIMGIMFSFFFTATYSLNFTLPNSDRKTQNFPTIPTVYKCLFDLDMYTLGSSLNIIITHYTSKIHNLLTTVQLNVYIENLQHDKTEKYTNVNIFDSLEVTQDKTCIM